MAAAPLLLAAALASTNMHRYPPAEPWHAIYRRIVEKTDRGPKKAYKSNNHQRNFIECVRSRKECICPAETGHRSATPGHIAYASAKIGRAIQWDPEREECIGDKEADKILKTLNYRGDWKIS